MHENIKLDKLGEKLRGTKEDERPQRSYCLLTCTYARAQRPLQVHYTVLIVLLLLLILPLLLLLHLLVFKLNRM